MATTLLPLNDATFISLQRGLGLKASASISISLNRKTAWQVGEKEKILLQRSGISGGVDVGDAKHHSSFDFTNIPYTYLKT